MHRIAHLKRHGIRLGAGLLGVALLMSVTGCSLIAGDLAEDEVEEIPAALLASDIGVTEAFAVKATNGLSFDLWVGVDLDDAELTDEELASILQIVVDENDLPTDSIRFGVDDVDGVGIDVESMMERVVPGVVEVSSSSIVWITMDGAREIIDAVGSEQS
ncbi:MULTISPECIES: hypothetical protein [unclassified Microbacterium]|uniref:hypothetical protein n=1 Tax=unclassified Microbacterium TaxID=2609290 RepID=UPI0036DE1647